MPTRGFANGLAWPFHLWKSKSGASQPVTAACALSSVSSSVRRSPDVKPGLRVVASHTALSPPIAGRFHGVLMVTNTSTALCRPSRSRFFRRNDGQQQIRRFRPAEMQCRGAVEQRFRPVAQIVVQERAATGQFVLEIRQLAARAAAIDVVLAAPRERNAVTGGRDDRGRPQLDVEFDGLALLERLLFVVRVIGAVGLCLFLVVFVVCCSLFFLCVWGVWFVC